MEKSKVNIRNAAISAIASIILMLGVIATQNVSAASVGSGITPDITTERFAPKVWFCGERVVYDDNTEPGRVSGSGENLVERFNNYAFEGEKVKWNVLVLDKNGIGDVRDVFVTLGSAQGTGNDIEANCILNKMLTPETTVPASCNARLSSDEIKNFASNTAAFYTCTFSAETPESMYGEYWVTIEAEDSYGLSGSMDENEYWFFNPVIALSIDGDMRFEDVRPGTSAYSKTLAVGNDADSGSGVMLDMFISGTDFYDSSSSGAMCPTTNQLKLSSFRYYAAKGAYSTNSDLGAGRGTRAKDAEGYIGIGYGIGFNNPNKFYDGYEIMQSPKSGAYYPANLLSPGSEMSITFRLDLPEPCNGDFDSGKIYFWGEAV